MNKNKPYIQLLILLLFLIVILYNISYKIPKIAYSYWDKNTPPIIDRIIEERRKTMPDWKIILLTDQTINNYIDMKSVPSGYEKLKPQHQADWIRLKLLDKYGGLWLDSSIIINDGAAINEIYNDACKNRVEVAAFTLDRPNRKNILKIGLLWRRLIVKLLIYGSKNMKRQLAWISWNIEGLLNNKKFQLVMVFIQKSTNQYI